MAETSRKLTKRQVKALNRVLSKREKKKRAKERRYAGQGFVIPPKERINAPPHDLLEKFHPETGCNGSEAALEKLWCAVARTKLIHPERIGMDQLGKIESNNYRFALAGLASSSSMWLRDPVEWRPTSKNDSKQFRSLVRHLIAQYPMPYFMDCAWFIDGFKGRTYRSWYLAMARGQSPRRLENLPFELTKRCVHHFQLAPADLTIEQALLWGQIRALGGSERLARALMGTRMEEELHRIDFWNEVIEFFVQHPELDSMHYGPIIDYVHQEKFGILEHQLVDGELRETLRVPPRHPNLTMKGRTVRSLLAAVERWHRELASIRKSTATHWQPSGIKKIFWVEGKGSNQRKYWMKELLCSRDLIEEGRRMHHCVRFYSWRCAQGLVWIFSLRYSDQNVQNKPLVTVSVRPRDRMIVEARGPFNRLPNEKEKKLIDRWAAAAGLAVAGYCFR